MYILYITHPSTHHQTAPQVLRKLRDLEYFGIDNAAQTSTHIKSGATFLPTIEEAWADKNHKVMKQFPNVFDEAGP